MTDGTQETTDPKATQGSTRPLHSSAQTLQALRERALEDDARAARRLAWTMLACLFLAALIVGAILFGCADLGTLEGTSTPPSSSSAPGEPLPGDPATPMLDATLILGAWGAREFLPGGLLSKVAKVAVPLAGKVRDAIMGNRPPGS